jgi:hypothetical protein
VVAVVLVGLVPLRAQAVLVVAETRQAPALTVLLVPLTPVVVVAVMER